MARNKITSNRTESFSRSSSKTRCALYFPSGVFWQFDCASQGIEGDATARYPTLMEDTNGNQILIRYKAGVAALNGSGGNVDMAWANSSSRMNGNQILIRYKPGIEGLDQSGGNINLAWGIPAAGSIRSRMCGGSRWADTSPISSTTTPIRECRI